MATIATATEPSVAPPPAYTGAAAPYSQPVYISQYTQATVNNPKAVQGYAEVPTPYDPFWQQKIDIGDANPRYGGNSLRVGGNLLRRIAACLEIIVQTSVPNGPDLLVARFCDPLDPTYTAVGDEPFLDLD